MEGMSAGMIGYGINGGDHFKGTAVKIEKISSRVKASAYFAYIDGNTNIRFLIFPPPRFPILPTPQTSMKRRWNSAFNGSSSSGRRATRPTHCVLLRYRFVTPAGPTSYPRMVMSVTATKIVWFPSTNSMKAAFIEWKDKSEIENANEKNSSTARCSFGRCPAGGGRGRAAVGFPA